MKLFSRLSALCLLALMPAAVSAQLFAGTPASQEYLNFVSGSGQNGTYGVQVGPYVGEFREGGPSGPASPRFSLYCIDYTHYASDQWVNVSSLDSPTDGDALGLTRLGTGSSSYARYQHAAYLTTLFESWADLGFSGDRRTVWSGIHAAIWSVTSGVTEGSGSTASIRDQLLAGTWAVNAANFDASDFYVLTPDATPPPGYSNPNGQEFLIRTSSTVPEPSTYVLLGSGLLLLMWFGRRRFEDLGEEA